MIPYGRQHIDQSDIDAVTAVLKSDYLTQGPAIQNFENDIAKYCGAPYALALSSATASLHVACMSLGLGKNDILWTSPNTFPASSNAALFCGAQVDFVDIDPSTYNMSVEALASKLEAAKSSNKLPKIVMPVHFAGQSCDMKGIYALSVKYGFHIIEDASHCIGASYDGNKIGSCQYSDACVFSFHPVKIITTGEGGAVTFKEKKYADLAAILRTHGITRSEDIFINESPGKWYYEQQYLAPNYRMTDIQAALGRSQLSKVDKFVSRRRELATRYNEVFSEFRDIIPYQIPASLSSWHLYVILLPDEIDRSFVYNKFHEQDTGVNVHYIPVHLHPFYQNLGFKKGNFPNAENYYSRALTLPLYQDLSDKDQNKISSCLIKQLHANS